MTKTKWYAKPIYVLVALALVLSLGMVAVPMAGTVEAQAWTYLGTPPTIDGDLSEWEAAGTQYIYTDGCLGGDQIGTGKLYMAFDDDNFYLAYKLESAPGDNVLYAFNGGFWFPDPSAYDSSENWPSQHVLTATTLELRQSWAGVRGAGAVYGEWCIEIVSNNAARIIRLGSMQATTGLVTDLDFYAGSYDGEDPFPGSYITDGVDKDLWILTGFNALDPHFGQYSVAPPPTEVWVDASWTAPGGANPPPVPRIWGYDAFDTIQDGIDGVNTGGTVHVAAGTYTETLVVDKQLTLQGAGSASTIIDASGASAHGILLTAGGTSASQRLTIKGFTIKNSLQDGIRAYKGGGLNLAHTTFIDLVLTLNGWKGMEIHNDVAVYDMEIISCEFVNNGAQGLRTASNVVVDGMTITDSKFNGNSYGIYLQGTINGVTILRSEFNNSNNGGYGGYMTETGPLTNLVIEDSEFKNNVVGLMIWNVQDNADITITRTLFQDNDKWGVIIWGATLTDVLIEECTVLNNDGLGEGYYGIDFNTYDEVMTNVAVHFTSITGHAVGGGVKNRNTVATAIVDATNNWWGDDSGPYHPTSWTYDTTTVGINPGLGDQVSDYVLYEPWLKAPVQVYALLDDLKDELAALDAEAFNNAKQQKALLNKVDAVFAQIEAGAYRGAINKLENDVTDKIEKWIVDEDEQPKLIGKVNAVIMILQDLLE